MPRLCGPDDEPYGDLYDEPAAPHLDVDIGPGPAVIGHLYGPGGDIEWTVLEYRPVRFGFRRPDDCFEV